MALRGLALVLAPLVGIGCVAAPIDGPICGRARVEVTVARDPNRFEADLVFVIDASPTMEGFREHAASQVARMAAELTSGDYNDDGRRDFLPPHEVRLAVIDTDMGGPTCGTGDGGAFLTTACPHVTDGIATFVERQVSPPMFADAARCLVTSVGSDRCEFDRGMDAILAAIDSIRTSFGNPDAYLAVIVIAAEDDCSTKHPEIFSTSEPHGLLCHDEASSLRSVDEIAAALLALRPRTDSLTFGIVSGLPLGLDLDTDPGATAALPDMIETPDPSMPDWLTPACITSTTRAFPARRWLGLAQALHVRGAYTPVVSICADDYRPVLFPPVQGVGVSYAVCVPRELNRNADGEVACDVLMALPPIGTTVEVEHCADMPVAEAFSLDHQEVTATGTREVCRVRQVRPSEVESSLGWVYDDGSPLLGVWSDVPVGCSQAIALTLGFELEEGAELRVSCDEDILPASGAVAQVGTFCGPTAIMPVDCSASPPLACDPFVRSCQTPCTSDDDCPAGLTCDQRTADAFFDGRIPMGIAADAIHAFCIDPNCAP